MKRAFPSILMIVFMLLTAFFPVLGAGAPVMGKTHDAGTGPSVDEGSVASSRVEIPLPYTRPPRDDDAVDPYLREVMEETEPGTPLEILVQFRDGLRPVDRAFLDRSVSEVRHTFFDFDTFFCLATPRQIERLNENPRVFWIEYNEELEYHMDLSLETIKATDTMYSLIRDSDGTLGRQIDGSGVTAVVLDSGVDAGHPDLDYREKTVMNLKSNTDMVWVEMENTDTSSGHGTHCAGTVAGNGDASGGARRGVAPEAKLIGLSTGEAVVILNALGALYWVYEHSRPHNNPHNIRVVSNSWGAGGGTYDPNDVISVAINKITYENNVVCVFAAGNSGGDGTTIQSSNYGNTPAAICVAASERDGSGISGFSSRGKLGLNSTYPDIAAPGVKIWSTAARRTLISAMTKQGADVIDPYYFAISGTSMATPHISGVVSLLWQACPSMKVSYARDQDDGEDPDWHSREDTRMHESEIIMKASADYINATEDNGIPQNWSTGHFDKRYDISQGYGLVNVRKAVALALTLEELRTRDFDGDGAADFPNASVCDAVEQYERTLKIENIHYPTTRLAATWEGEWTRFTNQTNNIESLETDQSHYVYVPEQAERMVIDLTYTASNVPELAVVNLALVIDTDLDGRIDWRQGLGGGYLKGSKHSELDLETGGLSGQRGSEWLFNIEGQGFDMTILDLLQGSAFGEVMAEYSVGIELHLPEMEEGENYLEYLSVQSSYSPLEPLDLGNPDATAGVYVTKMTFDLGEVSAIGEPDEDPVEDDGSSAWVWLIIVLAVLGIAASIYVLRKKRLPGK